MPYHPEQLKSIIFHNRVDLLGFIGQQDTFDSILFNQTHWNIRFLFNHTEFINWGKVIHIFLTLNNQSFVGRKHTLNVLEIINNDSSCLKQPVIASCNCLLILLSLIHDRTRVTKAWPFLPKFQKIIAVVVHTKANNKSAPLPRQLPVHLQYGC